MSGAVVAEGLVRRFGHLEVVARLSFSVGHGEVLGLLGPNGAGKTTVVRMLTTLLRPSAGRATVEGFDVVSQASEVRRAIGYVPQMVSADGSLTARENLRVFARLYDLPRAGRAERIAEVLDLVGLSGAADREVRSFSGGMVRRLELGAAVLHRPPVLILDEPTVGPDPTARAQLGDHLVALAGGGTTVVLTTHDLDDAERLCDRS